jgi:hypothetical protein
MFEFKMMPVDLYPTLLRSETELQYFEKGSEVDSNLVPGVSPGAQRRSLPTADKPAICICRMSRNSGSMRLLEP